MQGGDMVTISCYSCLHPAKSVMVYVHPEDTCSRDLVVGTWQQKTEQCSLVGNCKSWIPKPALSCCYAILYLWHYFIWICYAQASKKHLQIYHDSPIHFKQRDLTLEPICPHTRHTHRAIFPNLTRAENEYGNILGKRCRFLVIHPVPPPIS